MFKKAAFIFLALFCVYVTIQIVTGIKTKRDLKKAPTQFTMNADGYDVTLYEFLDYGCVHCRNLHPHILDVVQNDPRIRYVAMPLYTDKPDGVSAAKIAYAAGIQGKFWEMHDLLINNFRTLNDDSIIALGTQINADIDALKADSKSAAATAYLKKNTDIFIKLGGKSIPVFFVKELNAMAYVPDGDDASQTLNEIVSRARNVSP